MSLLANSNAIESGGYPIQRSLRFRSSASAWLGRTPASAGNRTTWTYSTWIKLGAVSGNTPLIKTGTTGQNETDVYLLGGTIYLTDWLTSTGAYEIGTNAVLRDPSAWYHIIVAFDSTQATASNRVKIYVNGVQQTSLAYTSYPAQNYQTYLNSTVQHSIGGFQRTTSPFYLDGYLAEVNFIDGQALTPSSFGHTDAVTGVWQPLKYMGTYGTNGFYLPFTDNTSATTLAYDKSGNGNNWTANNISTTAGATYDSMTDVPTLTSATAANYCVMNPLSGDATLSSANLNVSGVDVSKIGTIAFPTTGKWYFEMECVANVTATNNDGVGIATLPINTSGVTFYMYRASGNKLQSGGTQTAYGATYATGDVIGVAYDADAGTLVFYKNNTSQGTAFTGLSGTFFPMIYARAVTTSPTLAFNAGQRPFSYTPPTGFNALNTFNLPDPTIKKPNQYMDATLYTGTGSALSVTNAAGFQPDFVWVKGRSGATDHALYDAVRGVQKQLESNTTTAETTETTGLTAFNSNGFSVGALAQMNTNAATYVGWQWKESATAGFDIVTYTGNGGTQNISHSLGVAPKMIIVKSRSRSDVGWPVYHINDSATPNNGYMLLNGTGAFEADSAVWNNTAPTSSVFTVGNLAASNASGATYVAYLFAEIAGFSKFGSFVGNGSSDGTFVYTGFRPKYILIKNSSVSGNYWEVRDTSRNPYNAADYRLSPDQSLAENTTSSPIDILSNGFKVRGTDAGTNGNGNTLIFAAFAESPFKYALGR